METAAHMYSYIHILIYTHWSNDCLINKQLSQQAMLVISKLGISNRLNVVSNLDRHRNLVLRQMPVRARLPKASYRASGKPRAKRH